MTARELSRNIKKTGRVEARYRKNLLSWGWLEQEKNYENELRRNLQQTLRKKKN